MNDTTMSMSNLDKGQPEQATSDEKHQLLASAIQDVRTTTQSLERLVIKIDGSSQPPDGRFDPTEKSVESSNPPLAEVLEHGPGKIQQEIQKQYELINQIKVLLF